VVLFLVSVEIAIFGWPLTSFMDAETAVNKLYTISYIILGLMVLSVLAGFAFDIQHQTET
jgi:predicted membrane channel-forming protein YqfA (hemolysin III family)